jgi:hypothetical protein
MSRKFAPSSPDPASERQVGLDFDFGVFFSPAANGLPFMGRQAQNRFLV